ncbi:cytochrome P450 [Colletotrichum godetiae]|uniref:Cytochrome P450 n=1 Tax=Colletotrichum godetiae TaxID=1209918 RepID=A0AAJ0AID3_9PEZI|nr:cytochrome P450 [Colletotrichum godetiae]KAK1674457.1 cytochrome P450 [Colletotrichum godetiae]
MAGLAAIAAAVAAAALLLRSVYLWLMPKPIPGLPHNKDSAGRISGDVPYFAEYDKAARFRTRFFYDLVAKHKSAVVQVLLPFSKPLVIVADYRESRDLMAKRSKELSRGYMNNVAWQGFLSEHFVAMEDAHPSFKTSRFLTKDLMTNSFLHSVSAPASHVAISDFIRLWKRKAALAQGLPFETVEDLEGLTYDIMMTAVFGVGYEESTMTKYSKLLEDANEDSINPGGSSAQVAKFPSPETPALVKALHALNVSITAVFGSVFPKLSVFIENLKPKARQALKLKKDAVQTQIDAAVKRAAKGVSSEHKSAVDYVVSREKTAAIEEGREPKYNGMRLNDMLWGYIAGGQDSTHSTLCFTVKYLGAHQEAQQKLRSALRSTYTEPYAQKREPTIEEILRTQVPYLDAFIEETLRLCSPAGAITKETVRDINVLGHIIPKGTTIMFLLTGPTFVQPGVPVDDAKRSETSQKASSEGVGDWSHSDFPAEDFAPERWLQQAEGEGEAVKFNNNAGPFMSFSSGPRGCWGKRLAYLELRMIVTLLVWNLEFLKLPAELEDPGLTEGLFTKPKSSMIKLRVISDAE